MAYFILSNINLQVNSPLFNQQTSKILTVSCPEPKISNSKVINMLASAEIASPTSLIWSDKLTLPARIDKPFPFQIMTREKQQENNPEVDIVLEGQIRVRKTEGEYSGWQVFSQGKSVGYLFANIDVYNKLGTRKELKSLQSSNMFFGSTIAVKKDTIAVTSIYANFPGLDPNEKIRVFIEFQLGSVIARSAIKRLTQNQYRSFQMLQIAHGDPRVSKLTATGVLFDSHTNKAIRLGKGTTSLVLDQLEQEVGKSQLRERVKVGRVYLFSSDDEEVGWVSFKYLKAEDECIDPRFFLQDKFNNVGDLNFKPLQGNLMTISQLKGSPRKQMSGLQANSRIFIPKSSRFQDPAKRKLSDRIGLGHSTININQLPSINRYRAASIGFGPKHCPVERDGSIPGPGRYMTPTLFDCYRQ